MITEASKQVFINYAKDAGNWSGTPLVGGNVGGSKEERGNLTQLKRAGLITTIVDNEPGRDSARCTWVVFTPKGIEYATTLGIDLTWIKW